MCGIFAWAGKNPKNFDKSKYDILGIYNIERGKDSCGVSYDGEIYPGVDSLKLYSDFMIKNPVKPRKYPVVIGHTRQASVGLVNAENAHPFGFGETEEGNFEFIGCHNGTLYNKEEIAKNFNIETYISLEEKKDNGVIVYKNRTKIDSEILLESIYTSKNFKVLSQYNGAAALVFTNTLEPNVIYAWKGASKFYNYSTNKVVEERPLFYYRQSKNSLYISSLEKSLCAIGGVSNKNVFSFDENTIYKITDGDIDNAEKIIVSRANATQKDSSYSSYSYPSNSKNSAFNFNDDIDNAYSKFDYRNYTDEAFADTPLAGSCANFTEHNKKLLLPSNQSSSSAYNIYTEKTPHNQNNYRGRVYFNKFRYWTNGHLVTGIYTWIPCYGFYYLGEKSIENALNNLKRCVNKPFVNGDFIMNTDDIDLENPKIKEFMPFKENKNYEKALHFFIQGVRLLDALDYKMTYSTYYKEYIKKGNHINYLTLSHMSNHPVIDITVKNDIDNNKKVMLNGSIAQNEKICPLLSERIYHIENGKVTKFITLPNDIFIGITTHENYLKVKSKDDLIKLTTDDTVNNSKISNLEQDDEESIINQLIDEQLTEMSVDVDELIKMIDTYMISDEIKTKKINNLRILQDWLEVVNTDDE